tara:strand:+ start:433 stop:1335 length:903 start_codon:yes stop_codon:yes gene_type:complete
MPLLGTFAAGSSRGFGQKGGSPKFIVATGGTITTDGNFKIHTFTSPGTFCVSCAGNPGGSDTTEYLVVAGGGGGGQYVNSGGWAGGGGAGGYRQSNGTTAGCYPVADDGLAAPVSGLQGLCGPYTVTIGNGGGSNSSGANSVFGPISATGGGNGFGFPGISGGPGGGGGQGGNGNAGGYSPPEGFPNAYGAGNGSQPQANRGNGYYKDGQTTLIQGPFPATTVGEPYNSTRWFAGAGGTDPPQAAPVGGYGGGGNGQSPGTPGDTNTGGGGGAGGQAGAGMTQPGGSGGSGVVIVRYKFQ